MYGAEELVPFRRIEVLIVVLDVRPGAFLLRHVRQPFLLCAAVVQADHDFHSGKTVCQRSYLQQQILPDFGACPLQQIFVELCIIWPLVGEKFFRFTLMPALCIGAVNVNVPACLTVMISPALHRSIFADHLELVTNVTSTITAPLTV